MRVRAWAHRPPKKQPLVGAMQTRAPINSHGASVESLPVIQRDRAANLRRPARPQPHTRRQGMEPPLTEADSGRRPIQPPASSSGRKREQEEEEEATLLVGPARARQESRYAKLPLGVKWRKSNRMSRTNRIGGGGDLLSCLSEFLASRNVINRTERYEKIDNNVGQQRRQRNRTKEISGEQFGCFECPHLQNKWPTTTMTSQLDVASGFASLPGARLQQAAPRERVKKFKQGGQWRQGGKHGIGRLLADVLSGRHGNRLVPLLKLLRAPIVLAAMFSFALAISLFTLYTLSFHHCQTRCGGSLSEFREANFRQHPVNSRQLRAMRTGNSESGEGPQVRVQTQCGFYEGKPEGAALKFRGVAYASPPVGPRRWQKPRAIWLDEELCPRDSNWAEQVAREHCVQLSPFNHRVSGSEDCLYLDIYTPARLNHSGPTSAQRLPVMVYIHGGFLVFGSNGAEPQASHVNWMSARPNGQLASELNVVLVAPNYRLQALGFMALKQLALDNGPDGSEGNYGLWDQLIALQWIRRNIDSFGGDPNNVILFGPDSASALPLALVSRKQRVDHDDDDEDKHSANSIECAAKASEQTASLKLQACRENNSDDDYEQLFHSVWLMNPTIYYELPYELANQHYSRLIRSQSVCSSDLEPPPCATVGEDAEQNHTSRYVSRLAEWRETHRLREQSTASNKSGERLLDCLIGLSGEQIVREYLGRDDAAFRLDDENSLPIRNIFPDQFVTLDGQLVRDSFPFLRSATAEAAGKRAERGPRRKVNFIIGSTAQAVEFWPCPRNLRDWSWLDFKHYVATSLNSFNQANTFERANELYGVPAGDECLANQSSCPNATLASPMETYLTMVSDIRQVCPAHELSRSLRLGGRVGSIERYIVEWRPSARLSKSMAESGNWKNASLLKHAFHYWDLLALFGFEFEPRLEPDQSDLEFQHQIRSMAKRVAWYFAAGGAQSTKNHDEVQNPAGDDDDKHAIKRARQASTTRNDGQWEQNGRFTVFTLDNQVRIEGDSLRGDEDLYKWRECKMWQQSLKQSYAWIS